MCVCYCCVCQVPVLAQQRPIYYSDLHSRFYHPLAYFVSIQLVQLPIIVLEALLLMTPVYGLSGLAGTYWTGQQFWSAYFIVLLTSFISRTFMLALYAASPNEAVADVLNQVTNILFSKLCGYFIPAPLIPKAWKWYVSSDTHKHATNTRTKQAHACTHTPSAQGGQAHTRDDSE